MSESIQFDLPYRLTSISGIDADRTVYFRPFSGGAYVGDLFGANRTTPSDCYGVWCVPLNFNNNNQGGIAYSDGQYIEYTMAPTPGWGILTALQRTTRPVLFPAYYDGGFGHAEPYIENKTAFWNCLSTVTTPVPVAQIGHFQVQVAQGTRPAESMFIYQGDTAAGGFSSAFGYPSLIDFVATPDGEQVDFIADDESVLLPSGYYSSPHQVLENGFSGLAESPGIVVGRVIVRWDWDFGDGTTFQSTTKETSHTYETDGEFTVTMTPVDNYGLRGDTKSRIVTIEATAQTIDTLCDRTGAIFSAVNSGANVVIYRFPNGAASRETVATLPALKSPSFCIGRGPMQLHSEMWLLAQNGAGNWVLHRSDNKGKTWPPMTTAWTSNYKSARIRATNTGALITIALNSSTGNFEFKISRNLGQSWDAAVVIGAAGVNKTPELQQRHEAGRYDLIASNGTDKLWRSDSMGKEWAAL